MWIDAMGVSHVLETSRTYAYKVIRDLKAELAEKGYYNNPNQKVPISYFCERFGLDEGDVKQLLRAQNVSTKEVTANVG